MAQGLPGEAFEALGRAFVECQMKPEQELELTVRALVFADLIPGETIQEPMSLAHDAVIEIRK